MSIHWVPLIWSSDIRSFRFYGQYFDPIYGPKWNLYKRFFRKYGHFGFMVNFHVFGYKFLDIRSNSGQFCLYGQLLAGPNVDHISGTECISHRLQLRPHSFPPLCRHPVETRRKARLIVPFLVPPLPFWAVSQFSNCRRSDEPDSTGKWHADVRQQKDYQSAER